MVRIKEELKDLQPYKPGKPVDEVKRELGLKEAVKLASNENPFGPSRLALSALRKNLNEINRYPDGGCYYLRKKLAKRHSISDDRLIFGNGSDELIVLAIKALLNKGDTVIIAEPTFLIYRLASKIAGMKTKFIPLNNLKYDLAAMTAAIDDSTKMIFIANPDNPTGTYVNDEEVKAFIEMVPDDVLLFFDEAYYEYAIDGDYPDTLKYQNKGNIITTRTFSKIYGLAGLRVGYGVSTPEIIELMNKVREPFNVNSLAQVAALAALDDKNHVRRVRRLTDKGKKQLYTAFEKLGVNYVPSATNFILVDFGENAEQIYNELMKKGIITRYMSAWGLKNYIRVTIGTEDENKKLIKRLNLILKG
ncbi:histidinol-phosphate transaminase [[Eubacterium] cellulosolvens]